MFCLSVVWVRLDDLSTADCSNTICLLLSILLMELPDLKLSFLIQLIVVAGSGDPEYTFSYAGIDLGFR